MNISMTANGLEAGMMALAKSEVPVLGTINAKYNTPVVASKETPRLHYMGIGIGGTESFDFTATSGLLGSNGLLTDLRRPIPMCLRKEGVPLTPDEAALYRVSDTVQINGINYTAYYLIDISKVVKHQSVITKLVASNTDGDTTEYTYNSSEDYSAILGADVHNARLETSISFSVGVSSASVNEIINVFNIMFPDSDHTISEFGLYTGVDIPRNDNTNIVDTYGVNLYNTLTGQSTLVSNNPLIINYRLLSSIVL